MKQAARIDANQPEIVKKLRDVGATVAVTSALGNGFVDIVVGYRGTNYLLEIKDGSKPPSKRKLTEKEKVFHHTWNGSTAVVESADDALRVIGAI